LLERAQARSRAAPASSLRSRNNVSKQALAGTIRSAEAFSSCRVGRSKLDQRHGEALKRAIV
jgi:hypothetical protein